MLKKLILTLVTLTLLAIGLMYGAQTWIKELLPEKAHFTALKSTTIKDLRYITEDIPAPRGKILAVVTSVDKTSSSSSESSAFFVPLPPS